MTLGPKSRRFALLLFLAGCVLPLWMSLGDHPLYGRSDARYATVSATMAQTGQWLVPQLEGRPHLTKPPLVYWLEALGIRLLGQTEFAVRLPSALANTGLILAVFGFVHGRAGCRRAVLATGLLSLMPLQVLMGRLTLTDPILSLAWFGVLACSLLAVRQPENRRWPTLLWLAAAVGFLAKGPVVLVAIMVVALWLVLAGNGAALRLLKWRAGLLVAVAPVVVWGLLIVVLEPQSLRIWSDQVLGRFTPSADHVQPPWFFVPVFLAGLFPATAMMGLPGFNYGWRQAWNMLCDGSDAALWTLAVLVPLVVFSLVTGKLASYLLPLAAPLAIVTCVHLDRWLEHMSPPEGSRWPDVRVTFLVCVILGVGTAAVFAVTRLSPSHVLWVPGPMGLAMVVAAVVLTAVWRRGPRARATAMLACWLAMLGWWGWWLELEDVFLARTSTPALLASVGRQVRTDSARILTFGYEDLSLPFYGHAEGRPIEGESELLQLVQEADPNLLVIADVTDWSRAVQRVPSLAIGFEQLASWPHLPLTKPRVVLRLAHRATP